jgi:hypothetical protein
VNARGRPLRPVLLAAVALALGCSVPALDLADKLCASSADCAGGQTCGTDGRCSAPAVVEAAGDGGADLCHAIAHFTGTQVVDGDPEDLASIPAASYPWSALSPSGGLTVTGDKLDTTARVGWSDAGVHLYFHVTYETGTVIVPEGTDELWYGDALEIFVRGSGVLTGAYGGGADPGALQIIVVPDPTNPPRTEMAVGYGTNLGPLAGAQVAAVRDATGYGIEAMLPWSRISAADASAIGPGAGQTIGFMFGVDYRDREAGAPYQPEYQLTIPLHAVSDTSPCPNAQPIPSCDDRTWCTPTLLP